MPFALARSNLLDWFSLPSRPSVVAAGAASEATFGAPPVPAAAAGLGISTGLSALSPSLMQEVGRGLRRSD